MNITAKKKKRQLINGSIKTSLFISTIIIVIVQLLSFIVITGLMFRNFNIIAKKTVNELPALLAEPMYNVDDQQVKRIADAFISSNRVKGIRIESSATGVIIDTLKDQRFSWLPTLKREIEYKDLYLGEVAFLYNDEDFVGLISFFLTITLVLLLSVLAANYLGNKLFIQKKIAKSFGHLIQGIRTIAFSSNDYVLQPSAYSDIDEIITAMNEMSTQVGTKKKELQDANENLERRVAERTEQLETSLLELQLMQDRLVHSEKLTALGKLSAGVAHEFNTPLGAIISSGKSLGSFFDSQYISSIKEIAKMKKSDFDSFLKVVEAGISNNRELTLPQLTRKEIKALVKELETAGIPEAQKAIEYIIELGLISSWREKLPLLQQCDKRVLELASQLAVGRRLVEIIDESGRKATIVISALRSYLATGTSNKKEIVQLDEDVRRIIVLMNNMLKHGIKVHTEYEEVKVVGYSDKLSQVWMNLIRNAVQAMDYKGELWVSVKQKDDKALVMIKDSGIGIAEDIIDKIFEPFFSTRPVGEGMGLGLDICKKLIEEHKGTIDVISKPGDTVFTVLLPGIVE